jgi:hypothetical protein
MELEELKEIWKSADSVAARLDESQVIEILRKKSNSVIAKIKRNVWFEIAMLIVASVGVAILAWNLSPGPIQWLMYSIVTLHGLYLIYFGKKLQLLVNYDYANRSVYENLLALNEKLSSFLKFYRQSYALIYPVYILAGIFVVFFELDKSRLTEFNP